MTDGARRTAVRRIILAAVAAVVIAPAASGGLLLLEPATLDRDGPGLLVVLPDSTMLESERVQRQCAAVPDTDELVLELSLHGGGCRGVVARELLQAPISVGELPSYASIGECLAAHHAVFVDESTRLPICFAWFRCDALLPSITGPATVVDGDSVTLAAPAGYAAYLWSPGGETTASITVNPAVTAGYQVAVRDTYGCSGTSVVHTLEVVPASIFSDGFETGNTNGWSAASGR